MATASGIPLASDMQAQGFFEAGGGCPGCNRTGFVGRIGIFEYREIGPVADLLLLQRTRFDPSGAEAILSKACFDGDIGSRCMREDGILKASFGITTPDDVFGATLDASRVP